MGGLQIYARSSTDRFRPDQRLSFKPRRSRSASMWPATAILVVLGLAVMLHQLV